MHSAKARRNRVERVSSSNRVPAVAAAAAGVLAVVALHRVAVAAEEYAITVSAVAYQEHGHQEHDAAYGARLAFQEEPGQVQHHEHDVRLQQRGVQRFRYEQHGDQPLQTVHRVGDGGDDDWRWCL